MLQLDEVTGLNTFGFAAFDVLEVLEISAKDLVKDWDFITTSLPLIPSQKFHLLRIKTVTLEFKHIE